MPGETKDLYFDFVGTKDQILSSLRKATGCDTYDILAAVACGSIGGLIDVFLVGAPGKGSVIERWADSEIDRAVQRFARLSGWEPGEDTSSVAHAIYYLEEHFKINYDQRYSSDVGYLFDMNTRNHHMKSLAHSPSPVGLFFSVLNQFTSTASFVNEGKLITVRTDMFELQGGNVLAKLFCGFVNWVGHLMSDVAGSSITRRHEGDGTGVAVPFFELLQFFDVGEFETGDGKADLANLSIKVFQDGYDARFALAMGVPVVFTDLAMRLTWALRRRFQYKLDLKECVPSKRHDSLRTMLLLSNASLCVIDGIDAYAKSGGGVNAVILCERLNFIAWLRLAMLVARELRIRASLERDIEAMKQINAALDSYLIELRSINIEKYEWEVAKGVRLSETLAQADNESDLNALLLEYYESMGIKRPWEGSFDEHMSNRGATLRFS